MEQLARLRARLATLSELGDIIVAMRALATAAVRESRQALPAIEAYARLIEDGVADVAAMLEASAEEAAEPANGERETICLIGSDHGFVGNLNSDLLDGVDIPRGSRLIVVGRRLQGVAEERELAVATALPMTAHVSGVPLLARKIAECIGAATDVRLVSATRDLPDSIPSNQARVGIEARQGVQVRQVLPIELPALGVRTSPPPLHQLEIKELLTELAGEYLLLEISRALVEALAEENRVRLGVMTAAVRNISDKLDNLRQTERTLRQETITTELLDVVVGAEAVIDSQKG
jgi:F-type H+-transporting ATPase subunit gamma